jgi:predicted ATP-dependent endonuclease of OLD family
MNIFYLHKDPTKAANAQYNKHVVKMILESAQLLCTAHLIVDGDNANVPYKATHKNHPSAIWARESLSNYYWLYDHMIALGKEYTKRYSKEHLTIAKCKEPLKLAPKALLKLEPTEMPQCMPDAYKVLGNSVKSLLELLYCREIKYMQCKKQKNYIQHNLY